MPRLDNISQYIRVLEELQTKLGEIENLGVQESIQALGLVIKALEKYRNSQGQFIPEPFPLRSLEQVRSKLRESGGLGVQESTQTLSLVIDELEKYEG